jgi:hypothetical protein
MLTSRSACYHSFIEALAETLKRLYEDFANINLTGAGIVPPWADRLSMSICTPTRTRRSSMR